METENPQKHRGQLAWGVHWQTGEPVSNKGEGEDQHQGYPLTSTHTLCPPPTPYTHKDTNWNVVTITESFINKRRTCIFLLLVSCIFYTISDQQFCQMLVSILTALILFIYSKWIYPRVICPWVIGAFSVVSSIGDSTQLSPAVYL